MIKILALFFLFLSVGMAWGQTITSITPNAGPTAGGQTVVIAGTNLTVGTGAYTITIGGSAATYVSSTATSITCTTPVHAAANFQTVSVTRTGTGGTNWPRTLNNAYSFTAWSFNVTAPNGGENWGAGTTQDITWTDNNVPGSESMTIEYSTNGGANWTLITNSATNTGTYAWTIPTTLGANYRVRVTSNSAPGITDASSASFSIVATTVALTSPNGGENWVSQSNHNITWTDNNIPNGERMGIDYSVDGGTTWTPITNNTPNGSSYSWAVPFNITSNARVRVYMFNTPTVIDGSNANFQISAGLTVTSPNGGENWVMGDSHNITWSNNGVPGAQNVKLEYSTDGGTGWTTITASTPNDGSQAWTIPANMSTNCLVRVSSVTFPSIIDQSNNPFAIVNDCGRIFGYVTVAGVSQANYPVHLTGYNERTVLTNASGMYTFDNLPVPGNGTCGVGATGAVNYTVNIQPYGQTANVNDLFYAIQLTGSGDAVQHDFNVDNWNPDALNFNIGGKVTLSGTGAVAQSGVSLQLYQRTPGLPDVPANWTSIGTTTTDVNGNYLFTHVGAGNNTTANIVGYTSYRVIASKGGFAYSPTDGTHGDNGYIYLSDLPGDQLSIYVQAAA